MYKRLMFLISFVCLLAFATSASAVPLTVNWPNVHTVVGDEMYTGMTCTGIVVVPVGTTLTIDGESDLGGNGTDGEGGTEYATIDVNGGTVISLDRFNVGKGGDTGDGYIIIQNGGTFTIPEKKLAMGDSDGGVHRLIIIEGTFTAKELDWEGDRDCECELSCGGAGEVGPAIITRTSSDGESLDGMRNDGYLYCSSSCPFGSILVINDLPDDVQEAYCFVPPQEAWNPNPPDGALYQTVDVNCTWTAGTVITEDQVDVQRVFLGTSFADVNGAIAGDPEEVTEVYYAADPNVFKLSDEISSVLWKTYYWRIDGDSVDWGLIKGNVWSFTTGCDLPCDINLDCLCNLEDYAMLAEDWFDTTIFPDDF